MLNILYFECFSYSPKIKQKKKNILNNSDLRFLKKCFMHKSYLLIDIRIVKLREQPRRSRVLSCLFREVIAVAALNMGQSIS